MHLPPGMLLGEKVFLSPSIGRFISLVEYFTTAPLDYKPLLCRMALHVILRRQHDLGSNIVD